MAKDRRVYRIHFLNNGKVYELYAREVTQSGLMGFVEASGLLFGEKSSLVVDPSEEALRHEFAGVDRTYIPMHAILRIDQVEKRGAGSVRPAAEAGKVTPFPGMFHAPVRKDS